MNSLLNLKNTYVNDIITFLKKMEILNFQISNPILYKKVQNNIDIIKKYNQNVDILSNNNITKILKIIVEYNKFINNLEQLIININNIDIGISKIDTSGSYGTITPIIYNDLEKTKILLINNFTHILEDIIQVNLTDTYKMNLLNQFNVSVIELHTVKKFILELNDIYLNYVKNNESIIIIKFIYDIYTSFFYFISGKRNQKIISEYISCNINIMKKKLLIAYNNTLPQGEFSLNKIQFNNNAKHNIPQLLIQTNNFNPSCLYSNLEVLLKEKLDIEISDITSTDIVNDDKLFNKLNTILSNSEQNVGFIVIYKSIAVPIEQQIITLISKNDNYINYVNYGINKKIFNNTSTLRYLENSKNNNGKNTINIYNNKHKPNEKNIFYILDTANNKDFRFLSSYNYGSYHLSMAEKDVQFIINKSYPKKDIEYYNNIINEKISQNIDTDIDADILLGIDLDFITQANDKIKTNFKNITLPYITKFNRYKLLSEIKNKNLINEIINYIIMLLTEEFEDYIFKQTNISIKKNLLTYFYSCICDIKHKYYIFMINIIDTLYKTNIINLSRSNYYSNSEVLNLYFKITTEILKNFVSVRHGAFILIKHKIELMNIINEYK